MMRSNGQRRLTIAEAGAIRRAKRALAPVQRRSHLLASSVNYPDDLPFSRIDEDDLLADHEVATGLALRIGANERLRRRLQREAVCIRQGA